MKKLIYLITLLSLSFISACGDTKNVGNQKSVNSNTQTTVNVNRTNANENSGSSNVPTRRNGKPSGFKEDGTIDAQYLLAEYYTETEESEANYKGKTITVTGSFDEYMPIVDEGKTVWLKESYSQNARIACRIAESEVEKAKKLKASERLAVTGKVGEYLSSYYLSLDNCTVKIINSGKP